MTYLGNLGAGSTFASDVTSATRLATSAPFARYLQEEIFLRSAFIRSGVMRRDPRLQTTVGTRIEVPFFDPINATEEKIESNNTWGTSGAGHFTAQKVTASTQYATITHRGFMFAADDLSKLASGEDPLRHFAAQLADDLAKKKTAKLVSQLEGLLGAAGPLNATNNLTVAVTTGADADNYLTAANIIQARYLLGERQSAVTTIAMHSLMAAYLEQVGMLTFSTDSLVAGGNITWGGGGVGVGPRQGYMPMAGLNVIVDDQMPILGTSGQLQQFVCYLMGPGTVYEGDQMPLRIEADRNIASLQDAVAVHYHHVQHIPGTTWAAVADNPTNTVLATAASWGLAYSEPRLIPAVRLVANSPFGGTIP